MDEVITQLGLLLTQTRFARRALEDIERATGQYGSYAFTAAITPAGSPPLLDGALRVHIVNLRDLTAGGGFGDTVTGLLGGIGSFIGNLVGGAVGGTIGSMRLAAALGTINALAGRVERIIDKLGLSKTAQAPPAGGVAGTGASAGAAAATPSAAGGQPDFMNQLSTLRQRVDAATALLRAANGTPTQGTGEGAAALAAPEAAAYRSWVDSLTAMLATATRAVGGLVVAIPTAIAALAWLLDRLPDVRNAVTDTLRFVVRSALVLRGAMIVLGLETIAMLARVAAMAVRTLADTVTGALAAIFDALAKLLDGALKLGAVLGSAITKTINSLLNWLVPTVDKILRDLGELRIFRLVYQLADIAHHFFGAGKDKPGAPAGSAANPAAPGSVPIAPPKPPDLVALMNEVSADAKTMTDKIKTAATELVNKPTEALQNGLTTFAQKLDEAAIKESRLSGTKLDDRLRGIATNATETANRLLPVSTTPPDTAFHPIAAAYGQWLATGGLQRLLDSMTEYFTTPTSPPSAPKTTTPATDLPMVQIGEVIIDIAGPPSPPLRADEALRGEGTPLLPGDGYELDRIHSLHRMDELRGSRGRRRPHRPIF